MNAAKGVVGLSVFLAVVVPVGLAACAPAADRFGGRADAGPVVNPAHLLETPAGAVTWCVRADAGDAFRALADAYNERVAGADGRIDLVELPQSRDGWHDQLAERQAARSTGCDVIGADVAWTAEFAATQRLYDLGPYLATRRGEFLPVTLGTVRYRGRDWAVPLAADVGLLYYRTDQVTVVPSSWQQVYAHAVELGGAVTYPASPGEDLTATFLEFADASGGGILAATDGRPVLDCPRNLEALRFLTDGLRSGAVPQSVHTYTGEPARRAFEAGRAAFHRNWSHAYTSTRAAPAVGDDVAATALPSFEGGGTGGLLGGVNLALSAYSRNPAAALRAIDWITSAEGQLVAAQRGLAPTLDALYDDAAVREAMPHHEAVRRGIEQASPPPVSPAYREISRIIATNVSNALSGRTSPEVALAEAQWQVEQALDRF